MLLIVLSQSINAVPSKDYALGPGDMLEIHAWNDINSDMLIVNPIPVGITTAYADPHVITVSRDGRVYIPMLGTISVTGITIDKLENTLEKGLAKFTQNPKVSVLVRTPKGIKVNIAGEVNRPGLYEIPDGNTEERTVLNYIKLAGGATLYAGLENVSVINRNKGETAVNLQKMISEKDVTQNVVLNDGDTVIVPQATNMVYVLGEVQNPGPQKFIQGASVADYVGMAGGLTRLAASDNLGIVRGTPKNLSVKRVKLNSYFNWEGEKTEMYPGDIVYVPQSWFANWADMGAIMVGIRDGRDAVRDLASPSQWEAK